jgi:hypothetical protein
MRSITFGLVLVLSACGSTSGDTSKRDAASPRGTGGSGGSSAAGAEDAIATVVGTCNDLPAAGTWQNITPPQLKVATWCTPQWNAVCPGPEETNDAGRLGTYGTNAFVLDPSHPGTVYLGTSSLGIWKSTDCGSTWVHVNTGQNGTMLDKGRNWTMLIDPGNSDVLYTVAGYGQGGIYQSTNGGVDWTQVLPKNILDMTSGGFMEKITMDPTNSSHLLAGFHADCTGTPLPGATPDSSGGWGCLAESIDAGTTWTVTTSAVPWSGLDGPGQTMVDAKTWFYATNGPEGLWRTTTGGVSVAGQSAWTKVFAGSVNGSVYVAKNGAYYAGGGSVIWSADLGLTWKAISNSPNSTSFNGSTPMVDDGTTLYVGSTSATYWTTPNSATPGPFTMIASSPSLAITTLTGGSPAAYVDYEGAHHLLYSSNMVTGFWRFVTE